MFSQFQNEIIVAVLVILVLLTLYLFSKKSKKKISIVEQNEQLKEEQTQKEVNDDLPKDIEEKSVQEEEEIFESLDGKEEGNFDTQDVEINPEQKDEAKTIKKRDVPPHEKITKQHFSEFKGERILVAEDNLINQKVISGLLADSGIELVMADDGQEALDILEKDSDFLMVLMDAHMPRVDGFEATRIIRKNPKYNHILVVALSGDTAADDIKKMRNAGMSEQLEKPLRMGALYDILYAYTGEDRTKEETDEEYVKVIETKELHGNKGLQICGGDENFYREILKEFVESYKNSDSKLLELIETDELKQADKLLLDIIGVSANIGADLLNGVAIKIKDAISDQKEDQFYELISLYRGHLQKLLKDINNY